VLRLGIVLAKEGGALAKMLPIFSVFAGEAGAGGEGHTHTHIHTLLSLSAHAILSPSPSLSPEYMTAHIMPLIITPSQAARSAPGGR
jgi:hypothetical protein